MYFTWPQIQKKKKPQTKPGTILLRIFMYMVCVKQLSESIGDADEKNKVSHL